MIPEAVAQNREHQARRERERMAGGRQALFAAGLREQYDLPYLDDGDPRHTLDLISPEEGGLLPVIVEIHGGAYIACEKNINRLHARWFAHQGFHAVNGDYTLHPEGTFRQNMQELADILSWVEENAPRYGFDTDRVYMSGDSAGGHLVLLYAMLQGNEAMRARWGTRLPGVRIRAAAATCPAARLRYDGPEAENPGVRALAALMFPEGVSDGELDELDVLRLIPESKYPPLIVTATPSDELLYRENEILARTLEQNGRPYSYRRYTGKNAPLGHVFNVLFPEREESREANEAIVEFFRAQG